MNITPIPWTNLTVNFWYGCTKVHAGCQNCYAIRETYRKGFNRGLSPATREAAQKALKKGKNGLEWTGEVTFLPVRLRQIAARANARKPKRIFIQSLGDVFHKKVDYGNFQLLVSLIYRADLKRIERGTHPDTWIWLTKRPDIMEDRFRKWLLYYRLKRLPDNWHFGCSICDQPTADWLVPLLLKMGDIARVLFVSAEPLLGPVDLTHMDVDAAGDEDWCWINALTGRQTDMGRPCPAVPRLDWVILGGESGPGARPMHPDWARGVRDQCVQAGVPFFFKQWGEWAPMTGPTDDPSFWGGKTYYHPMDGQVAIRMVQKHSRYHLWPDNSASVKLGKHVAGRELDGKVWDQLPGVM